MTEPKQTCPCCGKGELTETTYSDTFNPRGWDRGEFTVHDLEGDACSHCDHESSSSAQYIRNHIKIQDEKRRLSGLLTSTEIKEVRRKLHLTQEQAAKVFGGGENAFSKYERGEVIQSEAMDKLLRLATDSYIAERLLTTSGINPPPAARRKHAAAEVSVGK